MFIRDAFIASFLVIFGHTGTACANSCANVAVIGSFDSLSGVRETDYGISAYGTFRIEGEEDESIQPMFNLAWINCEKQFDDVGKASFECKVTRAVVWAKPGQPDIKDPNCSLDLDYSAYSMKELQKGVLTGIERSSDCYNRTLTIDRNKKRVYVSFERTKEADNYDKIRPGTCGVSLPRTQVLMNCTGWRKNSEKEPNAAALL